VPEHQPWSSGAETVEPACADPDGTAPVTTILNAHKQPTAGGIRAYLGPLGGGTRNGHAWNDGTFYARGHRCPTCTRAR